MTAAHPVSMTESTTKMISRFLVFCSACLLALNVAAAEAPDALVKRVSEEVLEIVKQDQAIRNGDIKKIGRAHV